MEDIRVRRIRCFFFMKTSESRMNRGLIGKGPSDASIRDTISNRLKISKRTSKRSDVRKHSALRTLVRMETASDRANGPRARYIRKYDGFEILPVR